jgi:hypothetical protein
MSLEKEPAGAFNKAQRLIEQLLIYTLFTVLQVEAAARLLSAGYRG